jgi:hypothetical protein
MRHEAGGLEAATRLKSSQEAPTRSGMATNRTALTTLRVPVTDEGPQIAHEVWVVMLDGWPVGASFDAPEELSDDPVPGPAVSGD